MRVGRHLFSDLSMAYPATTFAMTPTAGTQTLGTVDHNNIHNVAGSAIASIANTVLGTTAGTNVLKNFANGNFAARTNGETFGTPKINLGSDAPGDIYYRNSGSALTRLAIGTPTQQLAVSASTVPSWVSSPALSSKAGTLRKDLADSTGLGTITGVGFTPTSIAFFSIIGNASQSNGIVDSTRFAVGLVRSATTTYNSLFVYGSNAAIAIEPVASNYQWASVNSFNADGFTLSWTKVNSPTGTADISYIAYK